MGSYPTEGSRREETKMGTVTSVCGVSKIVSAETPQLYVLLEQFGRNGSLSDEQEAKVREIEAEIDRRQHHD